MSRFELPKFRALAALAAGASVLAIVALGSGPSCAPEGSCLRNSDCTSNVCYLGTCQGFVVGDGSVDSGGDGDVVADSGDASDAADAGDATDAGDSGDASDAADAGDASDAADSGDASDAGDGGDAGDAGDAGDSGDSGDASDAALD